MKQQQKEATIDQMTHHHNDNQQKAGYRISIAKARPSAHKNAHTHTRRPAHTDFHQRQLPFVTSHGNRVVTGHSDCSTHTTPHRWRKQAKKMLCQDPKGWVVEPLTLLRFFCSEIR